jgi:exodeoxyribonuclease V gamma subunit
MYPDFDALAADGRFALLAKAVYTPLLEWTKQQVTATAHATNEESTEVAV